MTKLSDTQAIILSAAAQREETEQGPDQLRAALGERRPPITARESALYSSFLFAEARSVP